MKRGNLKGRIACGVQVRLLRLSALFMSFVAVACAGAQDNLPVFTDVTESAGIRFRHSFGDYKLSNIVEGTGPGAMFFDYNNDGWLDIYFVNGAWTAGVSDLRSRELRGKLRNALYRSNRDGTFTDVTDEAGVGDTGFGFGCSAADFDGDGDLDLYVLNYGPNVFYRNNGDGTFTDISQTTGLDDPHWSLAGVWFDYDADGDLDVYVANYLEYDAGKFRWFYAAAGFPGPLAYLGQPDTLYRNNGDGTFTNVSKEAGVFNPEGRAMSVTVADLDGDGLLDIYVANDAMENYFYRNLGGGKFEDQALVFGLAFGEGGQNVSSMGPCVGDVNRDGKMDLFIPDMGYSCLLINRGHYFEDQTAATNLALVCGQYTGWGGLFLDFDNDGYLDIFMANGDAHHEFPEEDVLVWNNRQGQFVDVAKQCGEYFSQRYVGRGSAYGDYDNDGDLDLLVVNLNDSPRLLRNDGGNRNRWLIVVPKLQNAKSDAIGACVTVITGELAQTQFMVPVTGYLSQSDSRLHFGLGAASKADLVVIRWPDGRTTELRDVAANQFLTVVQEPKDPENPAASSGS